MNEWLYLSVAKEFLTQGNYSTKTDSNPSYKQLCTAAPS